MEISGLDSKLIPIRPLTKGIIRSKTGEENFIGSFYNIKNYSITPNGPKRRGTFNYSLGGNAVSSSDRPINNVVSMWKTDGTQIGVMLTSRYLYTVNKYSAGIPIYSTYNTGTATIASTTATGVGTGWQASANFLKAGDIFIFDPGVNQEERSIVSINTDTSLTLSSALSNSHPGINTYIIRRRFNITGKYNIDSTVVPVAGVQKMVITDGARQPFGFDGTNLTRFDADLDYYCQAVCYFMDRLWMGNVIEGSTYYRQRLRWSDALDPTTFREENYQDIPYHPGEILRLVVLDRYLIAYFSDALYVGHVASYADRPLVWTHLDTGNIGLVGPRAVISVRGGHFFVGQNDIYYLDANTMALTPLGVQVKELGIDVCSNFERVYATIDNNTQEVIFGFPTSGSNITIELKFNMTTRAWSTDNYVTEFLANPMIPIGLTWDGLSGVISPDNWDEGMAMFPSWDSMGDVAADNGIYIGRNGYLCTLTKGGTADAWGDAVQGYVESDDIDFGLPDTDKTIQRLSVKLKDRPSGNVTMAVYGSVDGGSTWVHNGNIIFTTSLREGKVDFRMTGSTYRFKLFVTDSSEPYTITEAVIKLVERDAEYNFE